MLAVTSGNFRLEIIGAPDLVNSKSGVLTFPLITYMIS